VYIHGSNKYVAGIDQQDLVQQRRFLYQAMVRGFLKIILPLVLISALAVTALQIQDYRNEVADLRLLGKAGVRSGSEVIHHDFGDATADLRALADSVSVQRLLQSNTTRAKEDVARDFLAFSANKQKYDQIRYIDSQGMEVVRVNYNSGQPTIVPDEQLQNKADRYYFRDTISLARDEVFVSPLDLNIEQGQIEQPLKPVIRFGLPLYDSAGAKQGVLVINYLGDDFLQNLRNLQIAQGNETMLLNGQGYWLLAPDPADEWGFMFKNSHRFQNRFPDAWRAFLWQADGVYQDENGIFSYAAVNPMLEGQISSTGTREAYAPSAGLRTATDYVWTLVSHTPQRVLEAKQTRRWRIGLFQYGLLLLVLIPLALAFSWAHVRKRAADSLLEKLEQRMRDITRSLAVGLFVVDRDNRLNMMNPEAERLLGWTEKELYGVKVYDLFHKVVESDVKDILSREPLNGFLHHQHYRGDDRFKRKDGSTFHVSYDASPLMIDEQPTGSVVSFQDISDRKRMERDLERLATQDELTGLCNRRELKKRMDEEIRRAERYGQRFSIWMLDVDHFKQVNDTYGHQGGDRVLRILAGNLKQMLRETDVAARFGGEEFIVILSHTGIEQAEQMAERVREELSRQEIILDGGRSLSVTASIGVAAYPQHGTTVDDLITVADQALYAAKQRGRNQVCANLRAVS
jgi:diguanylate cyclase (GGDEF)-like protein/PAS domain S-box-containing protein